MDAHDSCFTIHAQHGIVSIATTMVIFAVTLVIAVSVQFVGVGELLMGYGEQQSEQAFQLADSCVDEALLRLKRNSAYTGGSLSGGSASCTITVSGSGSSRTVSVTATAGDSVRALTVGVALSGSSVSITSWSENTL